MANTTKVQPGLEAETAVIGALIYAPEIVKDVLFAVREQDFGIEINRKIFRAARDLYLRAKPVTAVTIRDRRCAVDPIPAAGDQISRARVCAGGSTARKYNAASKM